ncbi:MAG: universal stress protein [Phenylobacterium sp.]|uniref:universal stress protein n=1 Tax=Phenylobacterium sp. TaxID=1871053 RepID=UPI0012132243|nr:universal stress protein [Phenylobacterium sp.]TAJ69836.1 MAG: universal stress protein [Phenylobacterium sp.]
MLDTQARPLADRQVASAGYANILVHVEPGLPASHRTEVAAGLARDFDAHLIGVGAEALDAAYMADPYAGLLMTEWIVAAQEQVAGRLTAAEEAFRRDAAGVDLEWRTMQGFPSAALVQASRAADLIVVGAVTKDASNYRTANAAEVVMASGRPVLVTPEAGRHLRAANVVVAWKETREARRALADAMPFLLRAENVIVQAVCAVDEVESAAFQVNDVVTSLRRRGIAARPGVTTTRNEDVVKELYRIADLNEADLIVAGAYGHSRLAEWAFGGVTNDLLHRPERFVLTSH